MKPANPAPVQQPVVQPPVVVPKPQPPVVVPKPQPPVVKPTPNPPFVPLYTPKERAEPITEAPPLKEATDEPIVKKTFKPIREKTDDSSISSSGSAENPSPTKKSKKLKRCRAHYGKRKNNEGKNRRRQSGNKWGRKFVSEKNNRTAGFEHKFEKKI